MVEFHHGYVHSARRPRSPGLWLQRLVGVACLFALPGIWMFVPHALPEARIFGLAITIILIGVAGLCFFGRR